MELIGSKPFTFDRVMRILFTIAIVFAVLWVINLLKDVLLPFLVACLIAYLFEPFVQYNRRLLHLKGRIPAIFITLFEAVTLLGILLYFFVPSLINEMHQMGDIFRRYATSDHDFNGIAPEIHEFLKRNIDFNSLANQLMEQNTDRMLHWVTSLLYGGLHVILALVSWLIVFLYVIFIMLDYDRLMHGFKLMVPPRFRKVAYKVGGDMKASMNHYFRGQALICCYAAVIYCVGFSLCGLPMAIVIGLGTALLFMIPYCQYLSIIPVTLLCLVEAADGQSQFWIQWWECMAVFAAVQVVGDLILTPRIMGKAMGLNPAIILLSLSIWGSLMGFIGLIIALPLTTMLLSYYEEYIIMRNPDETEAERELEVAELKQMTEEPFDNIPDPQLDSDFVNKKKDTSDKNQGL